MEDKVTKNLKMLLQAKAQKKTNAIFVLACARGYLADVKALLEQGADIKATDKQQISGLHYACGQGRSEVVQFLWTKGVELDSEDPRGNLPLHHAVSHGRTSVVEVLLQKGAWTEGSNSVDDTILHLASRKGQEGTVKLLLEYGAKAILKDINKRGLTAFGEAVLGSHIAIARTLYRANFQGQHKCQQWTLLHICAYLGKVSACKYLIEAGAEVNAQGTEDGETPLHCAARQQNLELVKSLIEKGADVSIPNNRNEFPIDLAKGSKDLQKLLTVNASARKTKTQKPIGPKTDLDNFREATNEQRLSKIVAWAEMQNQEQLSKQITEFPMQLGVQLAEVKKLQQILNIQKVILEYLDDDDFQQQASNPAAFKAFEAAQYDKSALRRQADQDQSILPLLQALQKFQAVVRANGNHPVPFQTLLRTSEEGYHEKSKVRLKGVENMLQRQKQAAVAVALSENEADAKKAAEWELDPRNVGKEKETLSTSVATPPKSEENPDRFSEIQPDTAPEQRTKVRRPEFAEPQAEDGELDEFGLPRLPPAKPFTWKLFKQELKRAVLQCLLISIVFGIFVYAATGKPLWQILYPSKEDNLPVLEEAEL